MTVVINGDTGITSPADSLSGNLTFTGTSNRITGDFSNATTASRVLFQTSTTNGATRLGAFPNGVSQTAGYYLYNSSDVANASVGQITQDSAAFYLQTTNTGTGTALPMYFATAGTERLRIDTTGNISVATGNLTFSSTGQRITGDFSNATHANRVMFQTSTVNGATNVAAIPNGTATQGQFLAYGGTDPANTSVAQFLNIGTEVSIRASAAGTGTYLPMTFYTGGSERLRIDTSGKVGIGTSSPSAAGLSITSAAGSIPTGQLMLRYTGYTGGIALTQGSVGEAYLYNVDNSFFAFGTNNLERMRIDSSGNLLVGTTSTLSPGGVPGITNLLNSSTTNGYWALALQNNGTAATSGRGLGIRNATDFNTTANEFIFCVGNTTARFYVNSNGGIYNYQANNTNLSDRREKTNFAPAGSYLEKICAIPVQTFNYIDQNMEEDGGTTLGVVAQDVQKVAPEFVTEANWGTPEEPKMRLSIYETDLKYALMKCIQEQQAIIEQLRADVAQLKGQA